jgi:hypothetical protein
MKKYVVLEKTRKQGVLEILNKDTASLTDIWHSVVSFKNLINLDYKILTFNNRSEAEMYRKMQQKYYNDNWKKWGHYFKAMGQKKPKWVVEEYQNVFNSQNYHTV